MTVIMTFRRATAGSIGMLVGFYISRGYPVTCLSTPIGVLADGKVYIDGGNTYIPNDNATFNNSYSGSYTLGMSKF